MFSSAATFRVLLLVPGWPYCEQISSPTFFSMFFDSYIFCVNLKKKNEQVLQKGNHFRNEQAIQAKFLKMLVTYFFLKP